MPSSVLNASPSTVMPLSLSRSFEHAREWATEANDYVNGDSQRRSMVATSRKRWKLSKRLTAAELSDLLDFYETQRAGLDAFYFYDGTETSPMWSWDATGASSTGRYTVRFDGNWAHVLNLGRHDVECSLVEIT